MRPWIQRSNDDFLQLKVGGLIYMCAQARFGTRAGAEKGCARSEMSVAREGFALAADDPVLCCFLHA